jgi:hypothetical protein
MKWIYILKCKDDYYYIGQTKRLFRRFREHFNGGGGINTDMFEPIEIVGIYKIGTICKFTEYNEYIDDIINNNEECDFDIIRNMLDDFNSCEYNDYYNELEAENDIVECLMIHNKTNWDKIRGGKYVRLDIDYNYPDNKYIKDLPLCYCNIPCDIKRNEENNYLYFRCSKKNMWEKFKNIYNIDDPCNYFKKYTKDQEIKILVNKYFEERKKKLKDLFKNSSWLKNVDSNVEMSKCIGGCFRTCSRQKIYYQNEQKNLCYNCFINKNDDLKNKYDNINIDECLFID